MQFFNKYLNKIYKYLYIRDNQTILLKDIARDTGFTRPTVNKYIRWLERRELIERNGKNFKIIQIH